LRIEIEGASATLVVRATREEHHAAILQNPQNENVLGFRPNLAGK